MNILELDAYNLDDAVKFNDRLNPILWDASEHLKPEVRDRLLEIAEDFKEFLGLSDLDVKDITISGSNAAYTYTPNSDIDLHIVAEFPKDEVYRELFDAKKGQYNDQHNITIGGNDVELYVETAGKPPVSQGMYSVLNNEWIQVPRRVKANVDDVSTKNKFESVGRAIERAVKSGDLKRMDRLAKKIKKMRQTGLEAHGEFGPENLAFKILRSQGKIKELYDARNVAKDRALSLKEKAAPVPFKYGFKTPTVVEAAPVVEEPTLPTDEEILKDFIHFCVEELKIKQMPTIKLRRDPQWPVIHSTFGRYTNDSHLLEVAWGGRHIMDILRTVAHELTHRHQHERDGEKMDNTAGETGSPWENEANARAGILMRDYARMHPDYFAVGQAEGLHEQEVDEDLKSSAVAALSACIIGGGSLSGCATQQGMRPMDAARIIYNAKQYNSGVIRADVAQELNNFIRAQRGEPNAQNQSGLYQIQRRTQNESASGYIPTKKQAKDPRFSMALTQDIKPGQLGKEANKLKLKTDSQGHPQVANPNGLFEKLALELSQFKKKGTLAESEQLDEVSMRPSSLKQFANSPEAEGIQAGFEAELIFRDTSSGDDDGGDMEPDYDMDERCRSIQGVIDFFQNGEFGGMSPRQERALQEGLDEQYFEWQDEQMYSAWRDERDELIKEAWLREKPMAERIHAALVDGLDLDDRQADAIEQLASDREAGKIKGSDMSEEQLDMITQYSEAKSIAEDVLEEDVEQTIAKEDGFYDEVLDEFRDGFFVDDDSGFFDDIGLRWMSDVASSYDLDWPYMTGGNGNDGSRDWESIGDSLHEVVDMPVKVSSNYHSATRKPGLWIVEPDSSLEPDDREDYGLEIVSPPMPLKQALEKLQAVTDWANGDGDAYTNSSTGLHMGVSIPYKEGRVDYLKLILFLGDEYVLKQYGREANTYTKAAMKDIRQRAGTEKNATAVLTLLKNNLIELAERELAKSTGEGKYTSAHKHGKYIEFRSAGGDWLAEDNAEPGKLENTMMRYAYAMYLAGNPHLERREYAKKLYKLVANGTDDSTMALFSQYAAGELDKDQLKKRWAEKTLSKEAPSTITKGNWVVVDNNTGKTVPGQEYNGFTEDEVRERAKAKLSPGSSDTGFDRAYSIHPKETGKWEVYRDDQGQEETLEIIDADRRGEAVDLAYDKYTGVIPFKVRAYYGDEPATPEKELSPRAKLAKRIVKPKQIDYNYEIIDKSTGQTVEKLYGKTRDDAYETFVNWARDREREPFDFELRQIQQQGAVQDVEPNVAQNFSSNPNPTIQNSEQVRMPNGVPVWEIYDRSTGTVLHTFAEHTMREAFGWTMTWLREHGAEDPATYHERFACRPKALAAGERNIGGAQTPPTSGARPQDATQRVGSWSIYDVTLGREISRMDNVPWSQADARADELERSTGHNMSVRGLQENFEDGKGPGRPGDSVRHGIPKGATVAELEKASHSAGRKGQLARWQLNMRRGKKK